MGVSPSRLQSPDSIRPHSDRLLPNEAGEGGGIGHKSAEAHPAVRGCVRRRSGEGRGLRAVEGGSGGETAVTEGGFSRELLAIEDGTAEVSRDGEHIADLGPGDVFGEAGMLDDEMRSATVIATSRLKLISLGHFEVQRLKKDAPGIYSRIEELVEQRR